MGVWVGYERPLGFNIDETAQGAALREPQVIMDITNHRLVSLAASMADVTSQ